MSVEQFCSHNVITIGAGESVRTAAARMRDRHVGALVVTRDSRERKDIVGIVTDRDLVVKWAAGTAADMTVGELMSPHIVAVPATASLADTAATMHEEGVRRVLVAGPRDQLVGIVSLDDLIAALSTEMADLNQALRAGMANETAARRALHPSAGAADEALTLPGEALAARWRQITSH